MRYLLFTLPSTGEVKSLLSPSYLNKKKLYGKKADFGGVHIDISTSYENARNFIIQLYNLNSKTP